MLWSLGNTVYLQERESPKGKHYPSTVSKIVLTLQVPQKVLAPPGSQGHILRALLYCALFLLYSEYHETRPLGNQVGYFLLGTPKNQCTLPTAFNSTLYASGLISLLLNLGTSDLHFPVCSPTIPVTWCHLNPREDSPGDILL